MEKPDIRVDWDNVDEAALAIMLLGLHGGWRTWKGYDWGILNRLYERGFITDPKGKAKSVIFTEEGLEESQRLFQELFELRAEETGS